MNKYIITGILFISIYIAGYAQDSLLHYLEIAAKNNPMVQQRLSEYNAALQKVPQVGSLPDPELSVGVFLSPMELMNGNQVADIRLMQMFPWFGVLKNAKDEMSLMAKAKYESFRDAKLLVLYDVQRTWYELQKVQQYIKLSEQGLKILHSLEKIAITKFQSVPTKGISQTIVSKGTSNPATQNNPSGSSGMGNMGGNSVINNLNTSGGMSSAMPGNAMENQSGNIGLADLYQLQIEMGELNNRIALLKNQKATISARFNSYLNRKYDFVVFLPDSIVTDSPNNAVLALSDSLLTQNPMLVMLHYEKQSLDARKRMIKGMGYPMIGIGANYTLINKSSMSTSEINGADMIMPMVTITLPIYRKKYKAMKAEADLLKQSTEQNYNATSYQLQNEYLEAVQLYQDAERRMALYENQISLYKKIHDIMVKGFSASTAGLTEVLRNQQQLLASETKFIEAKVDYNTSIAWLKRIGAFTQIQ